MSNTSSGTFPEFKGNGPAGVVSTFGSYLGRPCENIYVVNSGTGTVSVLSQSLVGIFGTVTVPVGRTPTAIAIDPKGRKVYVANSASDTVSVIDITQDNNGNVKNKVIATIRVGNNPSAVAASANLVFVANTGGRTVSVIDPNTNTVVGNIPVGLALADHPAGLAVNGKFLYVALAESNSVEKIEVDHLNVKDIHVKVEFIDLGDQSPTGVGVTPDGQYLYVTSTGSNTVSVIQTATNAVTQTFSVAGSPFGVAVNPATGLGYITDLSGNTVTVIGPKPAQ